MPVCPRVARRGRGDVHLARRPVSDDRRADRADTWHDAVTVELVLQRRAVAGGLGRRTVGRLADLLDRAADTMVHVDLPRVTPLAVPVLTLIGREKVATGSADDALLIEAEALAAEAMAVD